MGRKINTFISVLKTFGFNESLRVIIRKLAPSSPTSVSFASDIHWGFADIFLEQNQVSADQDSIEIELPQESRTGFFDSIYDLGPELSRILKALLATTKPDLIVETGVAAGASTDIILGQLHKNAHGRLLSIDITANVGELVSDEYKYLWDLEILSNQFRKHNFSAILKRNSEAEIFLHDSDHSVKWQFFEILEALRLLPNMSYLLIDDVQPVVCDYLVSTFGSENCFFLNERDEKKSLAVKIKR